MNQAVPYERQAPRQTVRAAKGEPTRHVAVRTCVGCRRTRPRPQLVRLVATAEAIRVDDRQRLPGRGAYVCPDPRCVDVAARRDGRGLQQALRTQRPDHARAAIDALRAHIGTRPAEGMHDQEHTA